jgi:hypothetical protein
MAAVMEDRRAAERHQAAGAEHPPAAAGSQLRSIRSSHIPVGAECQNRGDAVQLCDNKRAQSVAALKSTIPRGGPAALQR